MHQKVFKLGRALLVALPKDMLDALGIEAGAQVSVELDSARGQIIVRPQANNREFAQHLHQFIAEYRPALDALAKGE